ncbi:MAG TPA: hypothetical protein VNX21_07805 [Candidatus Thermoplasmatota archaeon]|nr:hypothetical protein [Candidatus Thermoplasmatota archaeon]
MWGWLALLVGIAYGYFTPGQQDKGALLKKGLLIGLVVAVVLAALALLLDFSLMGFGAGLVASLIGAVLIVLLFVGGVWLGDLIESKTKKA